MLASKKTKLAFTVFGQTPRYSEIPTGNLRDVLLKTTHKNLMRDDVVDGRFRDQNDSRSQQSRKATTK